MSSIAENYIHITKNRNIFYGKPQCICRKIGIYYCEIPQFWIAENQNRNNSAILFRIIILNIFITFQWKNLLISLPYSGRANRCWHGLFLFAIITGIFSLETISRLNYDHKKSAPALAGTPEAFVWRESRKWSCFQHQQCLHRRKP